jgi:hypothetical protein
MTYGNPSCECSGYSSGWQPFRLVYSKTARQLKPLESALYSYW